MKTPPVILVAAVSAVFSAAVLGVLVSGKRAKPQALAAGFVVPDFELTNQEGRTVRRGDISAPWIASFLFTKCGTQCPMLTATIQSLSHELPSVHFVSFSVDPGDTPDHLKRYSEAYNADWMFLTGGPGVVRRLSQEGFKLPAALDADGDASFLHSQKLVLVDGAGRVRGYYDSDDGDALARLKRDVRAYLEKSSL